MATSTPDPSTSRLRALLDGIGELATFLAVSAWAVVEFCMGRWPGAQRRRKSRQEGAIRRPKKIAPYPVED